MKSFLTAGFALATCATFAAISEDFQNKDPGAITTGDWSGGTVEVSGSDKVLAIDGTVSCNNADGATPSEFVKTSFRVFAPADATAAADLPTGTELEDCQIAIATGPEATDNTLKVMVYRGGDTPAWTETGLTVTKDAWFTVTLHFDYTAKTAKVEIGGAVSAPVALVKKYESTVTVAKIDSLSFVGSSKIDNVSIAEAYPTTTLAADLDGLEIYPSDLTAAGLTDSDLSDDNVIKSISAGLTPTKDAVAFNATALSTVTESATVKTVITVPCIKDYGQVYKIAINDGTTTTKVAAEAGAIQNNSRALKFSIPSTAKVLKFQVEASAPSNS